MHRQHDNFIQHLAPNNSPTQHCRASKSPHPSARSKRHASINTLQHTTTAHNYNRCSCGTRPTKRTWWFCRATFHSSKPLGVHPHKPLLRRSGHLHKRHGATFSPQPTWAHVPALLIPTHTHTHTHTHTRTHAHPYTSIHTHAHTDRCTHAQIVVRRALPKRKRGRAACTRCGTHSTNSISMCTSDTRTEATVHCGASTRESLWSSRAPGGAVTCLVSGCWNAMHACALVKSRVVQYVAVRSSAMNPASS